MILFHVFLGGWIWVRYIKCLFNINFASAPYSVLVLDYLFVYDLCLPLDPLPSCHGAVHGSVIVILFVSVLVLQYADPVADLLDRWGVFRARLFRESCVFHRGNYVKDLSRLGRELNKVIIVDNSPASYIFHPENAVCVTMGHACNLFFITASEYTIVI